MVQLIAFSSKPSTRRTGEFTTWFRIVTIVGVCKLENTGWMGTLKPVEAGTVVELPAEAFKLQEESWIGREGKPVSCNHIVAR